MDFLKNKWKLFVKLQKTLPLESFKKGRMAERLGSALQKLLHRFESGSDLNKKTR